LRQKVDGAEYSERREKYSDADMCTPEMMGKDGQPVMERAHMTEGEKSHLRNRSMVGVQVTGAGRQEN
jgi:hypothetical protein